MGFTKPIVGLSLAVGITGQVFAGTLCTGSIGGVEIAGDRYALESAEPFQVGVPSTVSIRICNENAEPPISFDAVMPAHGHGLNYRPEIVVVEPGRWRVEGLFFHMAGRWEIRLRTPMGLGRLEQRVR